MNDGIRVAMIISVIPAKIERFENSVGPKIVRSAVIEIRVVRAMRELQLIRSSLISHRLSREIRAALP